ncbi:MAG TPA: D-alanyl-D-alanine carboxypeptidase/D-alanyl-D-alanine-endopeptidase [Candidatus Aquilonibacter sp.]|nr:D-alanyl-D-alanine carboxypeptidase/D-alanyl-D-alanine-endopeptidase [Candidatus Aquilonibacter sp.]
MAQFSARVDAALSEARAQKAFWGILVADRDTGKTLYELNANKFFAPASNAKLFTTSLALATLGPDYRYRTTLESSSPLSAEGKLSGDLILVGRGDPDLSNRVFPYDQKAERDGAPEKVIAELADAAVAKGLKEVDGDIVADDTYYPYDPYPAGWVVGDLFFSFGAPVSAIDYNDNIVGIDVVPGAKTGDAVELDVQPVAAREGFDAQVATSASGAKPDLAVVREPGPNFILLRGTVPAGGAAVHLELAMTQPAETAGRSLKDLLEARGVIVRGAVRAQHSPPPVVDAQGLPGPPDAPQDPQPNRMVLAEHLSPTLLESILLTNKISQNLHAEMFLREVGRQKYGTGSTAAGLFVERDFLHTIGIADGDVVLTDGSGLSPQDLVTPQAVITLLLYAKTQPWGADFVSTLPIAGVDGTLQNRFNGGPGTGLIHAKTGSIANVRAISGYATSLRGESLVFCIFGNNNPQHGTDATLTIDAIAAAMVDSLGPAASSPKTTTLRHERHIVHTFAD